MRLLFVLLLLSMSVGVRGAASVADEPRPEKTEKTKVSAEAGSSAVFSGKLLVVPMDGSHWVGIKAMAQELGRRGHRVTVVIPEVSMRMGPGKHYDTLTHPVPYGQSEVDAILSTQKDFLETAQPFMERIETKYHNFVRMVNFIHVTAESLLFNDTLISYLAKQEFDALLTDPMLPTGSILARKLGLPTINLLRGIPCALDTKSAGCPSPPSFVPRPFTGLSDRMNFKERLINTLVALLEPLFCRLLFWRFNNIAHKFLNEEVSVAEILSESDIWLLRIDFTLEFPRPLMPNMILVGGINCYLRKPLPQDLEQWVSGEHGFVVFTLGSVFSETPEEITSVFVEAFRQIPQTVIWRYTGKVPDNLPNNVKMMKWVPQNDLLAHSGVRAFITHTGSHGTFEGLCHAVPMLMFPILGDQTENAVRMAKKGAGIMLDISTVTTESLLEGLNELINNTRYKENIQRLSALHKDRPVDPLELSVFWTEFVMRHKGAKHLKAAVHDLNWIQYYCLDVAALLAAIVLLFVILTVKCMKLCLQKLGRKKKQD
uniref:glucuronosyltransferase n=1 Tax=Oryzias latipes TaxID=8090 RepID=A0A3P9H6J8_ORYLA